MNYDEAKKALHVLYADVNRTVLQMGPEMRASGLVSDEADLCEALQVLRQEMFASEPDSKTNLPFWVFARKHLGAEIARLEALAAKPYPAEAGDIMGELIIREFVRDGDGALQDLEEAADDRERDTGPPPGEEGALCQVDRFAELRTTGKMEFFFWMLE
jgi:hypothetical protein